MGWIKSNTMWMIKFSPILFMCDPEIVQGVQDDPVKLIDALDGDYLYLGFRLRSLWLRFGANTVV